jgi:4-amino-4-deoxy-L-arabinose transferase-like glycosyltransferase
MRFPIVSIIFFCSLLALTFKISDIGEHWDEVTVASIGESYLGFVKNGDFSQSSWELNHEHPPVAKYIYGVARFLTKNISSLQDKRGFFPEGRDFGLARFFSVLMSAITVLVIFQIALEFFKSWKASLFSSLLFFLNPVFQAYSRIVSLEVPLLMFGSTFVLFCLKYAKNRSFLNYLFVVLSLTLFIGTRYNGILLLPFFYIVQIENILSLRKLINLRNVVLPFLSLILLFIIWPYLWHSPITALLSSADRGLEVHTREYFLGQFGNTPWHYYLSYLLVKTPTILFPIFLLGVLALLGFFGKREGNKVVILPLFLLPFVASFVPLKQDGLRYVNLYLIGFSLISALGLVETLELLGKRLLKSIALIIILVSLTYNIVKYFPYYLDYYNNVVSSEQIYRERLYEIGGWGEGVLEAVKSLPVSSETKDRKVYFAINPVHVIPNLPNGYIKNGDFSQADFVLINTNYKWYDGLITDKDLNGLSLFYRVTSGGNISLVEVYRRQ